MSATAWSRRTRQMTASLSVCAVLASGSSGRAAEATLQPDTVRAWDAYVAATEARIAGELSAARGFLVMDGAANGAGDRAAMLAGHVPVAGMQTLDAAGQPFAVPRGTITHWRGSIFVPGLILEAVLARAQQPSERGPFQPEVLALRVLERRPDGLRLFIKMTRQKLVTVTYNSEHELTYRRHTSARASSRSVATKIAELETTSAGEHERAPADDHGFLWRLNSYWRYEQVAGGVVVELESLSLSRGIPTGLGLVARPIVNRVAHESMTRTLTAFRTEQLRADLSR